MNKKKILILLAVLVIAIGFSVASVSSVSAAKKTVNFKEGKFVNKYLGHGDYLGVYWSGRYVGQYNKNTVDVSVWSSKYYPKYYKITKFNVKYAKKVNGKTRYKTKTYKAYNSYVSTNGGKKLYSGRAFYSPKGWTPKKTVVSYKRK